MGAMTGQQRIGGRSHERQNVGTIFAPSKHWLKAGTISWKYGTDRRAVGLLDDLVGFDPGRLFW